MTGNLLLNDISALVIPTMTKAEKILVAGNVGMLVYDTTANKLSMKKNVAINVTSWENITSVQDS